jgi:hypothetical protein
MTKAGERLLEGAAEALAIAKGEQPAARIHIRGHSYVPERDHSDLIRRARIVSGMLRMGEPLAFGRDADIINELVDALAPPRTF